MGKPSYEVRAEDTYGREHLLRKTSDGSVVENAAGDVLIGSPVDAQSIVKRNFGRMAYGTQISIGIQQLLHPQIGAAVEHTGKFRNNPFGRIAVSMKPIMDVVYAEDPRQAGLYVRDLHRGISGNDHKGRGFNALNADAFYWAQETFRWGVENYVENYTRHGLNQAEKEQLMRENVTWYSYYGMPMTQVPADYTNNQNYRQDITDNLLEMTPAAKRVIDMALDRQLPDNPHVPATANKLAQVAMMPITDVVSVITIGELPPEIREKFGIRFGTREQLQLRIVREAIKTVESATPKPLKFLTTYEDLRRETGGKGETLVDKATRASLIVGRSALETVKQNIELLKI
jgi:uncharacterized protein (DUF2236 family)